MKMLPLLWLLTGSGMYACDNPANTSIKKERVIQNKDVATINETTTNSKAAILNNIIVQESGSLKIARAYLSFKDGRPLPKTNSVSLGEAVYLNLLPEKSWLAGNKKNSIDASQKIVTNKGELVLDTPSLFPMTATVDKSGFNHLYLQATISKTRRDIDYFIIHYRVWDKLSHSEVKGSYTLYVDEVMQ